MATSTSPLYSLTLFASLFFISNTVFANNSPENTVPANGSQLNNSQKVSTELASSLLFYPERKATALVNPINHAQVPAQISAQVLSVNARLGDSVTKDQMLVGLDCRDRDIYLAKQQSQYAVSQAKLHLAQRNYDRAVQLKKNRNIGEAELDAKEVEVVVAKEAVAQVEQAKKSASLAVERCQIMSPFDGVITQRLVSEGDYVDIGQPLLKVLEQNNLEVQAQIPVEQLASFNQAGQYHFVRDGQKTPLVLNNIVGFIAANSRSQLVTFTITPNNSPKILAGMNGMVSWQSKRSFLPAHLLTQRQGRYGIFVIETNNDQQLAKFIELPNAQEGRPFQLVIANEQHIIVDGRHRVTAGKQVSVKAINSHNNNHNQSDK